MALDFPASPSLNQVYPSPSVPGVPVYVWDGEKWASASTARAPFDAMAYSGLQINGGMEVSQEKGFGTPSSVLGFFCDGWRLSYVCSAVVSAAAYLASQVPGFPNVASLAVGTAQASMGADDRVQIYQNIEGYRCARLAWGTANAQPITIGFWSAHHRTGVYSGVVGNGAANRSYGFTYTQAAADVAQYNTVSIPGDTTGTWATDNTTGIAIHFAMACGATYTAPSANAWVAGNYAAAPGQINAVAATSDAFRITGIIVLPGSEAPSAARSPFVMRPYDQELVTCQRYWRKIGGGTAQDIFVDAYSSNTGNGCMFPIYHPGMRAKPTFAFQGAFTFSNVASAPTFYAGTDMSNMYVVSSGVGRFYYYNPTGQYISADARL